MPCVRSLLVLACVVALAGAVPSVAHEPSASGGGFLLDPDPEGIYVVPCAPGELLPLEFDAGETPFELLELKLGADRMLEATIQYVGEKPATAWAIRLAQVSATGTELTSAMLTEDWSNTVEPGNRIREKLATSSIHEQGLFLPGQVQVVPGFGVPDLTGSASETAGLVLSVPVVVFADTSFVGSDRVARQILEARKVAAEELAYWSLRLEGVAELAGTEEEALAGAQALLEEMAADDSKLPHAAQIVRRGFRRDLEGVIDSQRPRPEGFPAKSALTELRSLSDWIRDELDAKARHLPRELPEAPKTESIPERLQERIIGEGGDCTCGGSISTSVARLESRVCGPAAGWVVDEDWNYSCLSDNGSQTNSGTKKLIGYGGCVEGLFCIDDTYCAPEFTTPSYYRDTEKITWSRGVTDRSVAVGICTARCVYGLSRSVTIQCLCSPPPTPGCGTNSCPILIETGTAGFRLTDLEDGVLFDIDADGEADRVSWPVPATDDAWLALDRNGNGVIDSGAELFGDATAQPDSDEPNGFLALAVFDRPENGGDGDGQITAADAVFGDLLLWIDGNHDGVSSPPELTSVADAGLVAFELEYHEARRSDRHGNEFRYLAGVWHASGARRLAQDVFLLLGD